MNRKKDKLTVFGMALYCGIIFAVFLAWGMRSGAVNDLPGQERGAVFETISFGSKRNGSEPPKKTAGGISFSPRTPLKRRMGATAPLDPPGKSHYRQGAFAENLKNSPRRAGGVYRGTGGSLVNRVRALPGFPRFRRNARDLVAGWI